MPVFSIGSQQFDSRLIQAPLAGISSAPFRRLFWRFGGMAYATTEMLSAKTLLNAQADVIDRYMRRDPHEGVLACQLSGNHPKELSEAVKKATDMGVDLIDLNCGCPVKKIRSKGAGSALLTQPLLLSQLIDAMKSNTHLPVTIKIRVAGGSTDQFNQEIANVVSDSGLDALIVHGRHWREHYETPCNYDDIQFFVESLHIPVIGNGDVACSASLKKMLATGCAGVMIARASVGQPWLFAALSNIPYALPSISERGALLLEHVDGLIDLLRSEKFAIMQARAFGKYYARGCVWRDEFASLLNQCESRQALGEIIEKLFVS